MRISLIGILSAIALGFLPFIPWFGLINGGVLGKAFFLIGMIDLIVLLYARSLFDTKNTNVSFKRPFLIALLLVVAAEIAAAIGGVYFEHSFWSDSARATGIFFVLHIVAFAFVLGETLRENDWALLRKTIVLTAGVAAAITSIGYEGLGGYTGNLLWFNLSLRDPFFANETFLGTYFVLAAIIGCLEFVKTKDLRFRWLIGGAVALMALSPIFLNTLVLKGKIAFGALVAHPQLLLGVTRASSAVFFGAAMFLFVWWGLSKIPHVTLRRAGKIVWATCVLGVCVAGSALLMTPGSLVQNALTEKTTLPRFIAWESVKQGIAERPWLGWGPENVDQAFERHFNPALYSTGGRIETWFDRAHNVVLDTLATTGVVGTLAFVLLIGAYVFVVCRARRRNDIREAEAVLLLVFPAAHFFQLQTAFDVIATYALLGVVGGYVLSLEKKHSPHMVVGTLRTKIVAGVLVVGVVCSIGYMFFLELPREESLVKSLSENNPTVRAQLVDEGFSRVSDFSGLQSTTDLFIGSVFTAFNSNADKEKVKNYALTFLAHNQSAYERYLAVEPNHYRAEMNYAYLLLLETGWGGEDQSQKTLSIIERAYALSPGNPLTYVLDIVARAYAGDAKGAQNKLVELKALVPDSKAALSTETWLHEQEAHPSEKVLFQIHNL